jgi:hypothetical protein
MKLKIGSFELNCSDEALYLILLAIVGVFAIIFLH